MFRQSRVLGVLTLALAATFSLLACGVASDARAADLAPAATEGRLGIPLVNEPIVGALVNDPAAVESTFYECRPQHYNPPCRKISRDTDSGIAPALEVLDAGDYLELKAASDASTYLFPVSIGGELDDPIAACGNSHGMSGCCRIVYTYEDATGTVHVIECGNR